MIAKMVKRAALFGCVALTAGCATAPPTDQNNVCSIFEQYPSWYDNAVKMHKEWGTPISLAMAFVEQESHFRYDAKPPKHYVLGFIPWGRVSTAYGYAQAQDPIWDEFLEATDNGGSRTDFHDALMFIGWYTNKTNRNLHVPFSDTYHQYLAYHQGYGGFKRKTYLSHPWLLKVAQHVEHDAKRYQAQLRHCRPELERRRLDSWFF